MALKEVVTMVLIVSLANSLEVSDMVSDKEAIKIAIEAREEVAEIKKEFAWYSLHVAAAAACRGSTASGGTGPWSNAVLAKENTRSCHDQCASTDRPICDADVSIQGSFGKATSYTESIGLFYNYGCSTPGNTDVLFDEVKAAEDGVLRGLGISYYRFCCCRKP